jgi:hypothetical protein
MESKVFDNQKISMDLLPLVKRFVENITSEDEFDSVFMPRSASVYESLNFFGHKLDLIKENNWHQGFHLCFD